MVAISLPKTIENFEGEISHVVVAGSETLTFIKPSQWQEERKKISTKLRSLARSLKKFDMLSAVKSGEVYIANINGSLERSFIIRRPTPDTYSIYLIDKGMQCEAQFEDIYEFPPELLEFALFSCVCPVFVPSAEQLNIYKTFIGQKCKCEVETISKSFVVLGYVRGRLLIANGDLYEDIHVVCEKLGNGVNNFAEGSIRSNMLAKIPEEDAISWTTTEQLDDTSSSELTYRCSSTEKVERSTRIVGCTTSRKSYVTSKKIRYGKHHTGNNGELCAQCDMGQELFTQTAFKQYQPDVIPTVISVRFDKKDRALGRFWVINKHIFSTIERTLKENAKRIAEFPLLIQRFVENVQMREIPCVVRTRAESAYRALHRAVPSRFDVRTRRFSIFLVDFGWFKWVLANDVIDISAMDMVGLSSLALIFSNPIRNLPIAMIHCQEDVTSVLHAKDLSKGTNCYIRVKGSWAQDIYLVDLLGNHSTLNGSEGEVERTWSSKRWADVTSEQQLLASPMLGLLNIANRNLTQPQQTWPFYHPPFPMVMPVALPMVMPMATSNTNSSTIEYERILQLKKSHIRNVEYTDVSQTSSGNSAYSRNNRRQRLQNGDSQSGKRECCNSNFLGKSRIGIAPVDRAGNSFNESDDNLSWEQASKLTKDHRMLRKNFGNSSHRVKLTSWEKTVAVDHANRTQGSTAADEHANFHANNESN